MQTLALMLAAVSLSLLVGVPFGIVAGRSQRVHRAITPALDAMQIVPAFAYLMPVVILFSVGPAAAVICTMIYAIPPAVRITALGIRGVTADTVEASQAFGATTLADALQGPAAAGAARAAAGAQPDDHVRALARRDRGPDRRARARRRRHERAVLEPGARAAGRAGDRDHGDRARPRDDRDGRAHRPDAAPPDRRGPQARAAGHARHARRRSSRSRSWRARSAPRTSTRRSSRPRRRSTRRRSRTRCSTGSSRCSTTSRTRTRSSSASPSRSATSSSSTGSSRCASSSSSCRGT